MWRYRRLALASSICMICDWHSEMYSWVYWTCPSNIPITQFSSPISLSSCQQYTQSNYTIIYRQHNTVPRNHEKQQDTRRGDCDFKCVLTLPSLMATSLLRQNLSSFLQTLSLSCNGTNNDMIYLQNSDNNSLSLRVVWNNIVHNEIYCTLSQISMSFSILMMVCFLVMTFEICVKHMHHYSVYLCGDDRNTKGQFKDLPFNILWSYMKNCFS